MAEENERRVLVFVGVTGVGKSATCNTLAEKEFSGASEGFASATTNALHCDVTREGVALRIVDTVGFLDNRMSEQEKQAKFGQFADRSSFGVDIFLLTFKNGRFTEQDERCFQLFSEVVGPTALKHTIVVFTHISDEQLQKKLGGELPPGLEKMLKQVDRRVIGVENHGPAASSSLFAAAKRLLEANRGQRFSNTALVAAQKRRESLDQRIAKLENEDRKNALQALRVGLNDGTRTLQVVEGHLKEAEAAEEQQRQERQRAEQRERQERQRAEASERRAAQVASCCGSKNSKVAWGMMVVLLLAMASGVLGFVLLGKHKLLTPAQMGLVKLGSHCNVITADGCNPVQLPNYMDDSWTPDATRFVKMTEADIVVDMTEHKTSAASSTWSKSSSQLMTNTATEFGLSIPFKLFSLSPKFQRSVSEMHWSQSETYYAETEMKYITFSATMNYNTSSKLQPQFRDALDALPQWSTASASARAWYSFFGTWGTHYTKHVDFGGCMKLTSYLDSEVSSDTDESDWGLDFEFAFSQKAKTNFSWGSDSSHAEKGYDKFSQGMTDSNFFSIGGDQSESNYNKWMKTVKSAPTVIATKLAPLSDFVVDDKGFDEAVKAYYQACPESEYGICNGLGGCDPVQQTCVCGEGNYKDDDNLCYKYIDCKNGGRLSKGKCQCQVDKKTHIGHSGADCSEPCGAYTHDAGHKTVWDVHNAGLMLSNTEEYSTCWCEKSHGLYDGHMRASKHPGVSCDNMDGYSDCGNTHPKVCTHNVFSNWCVGVQLITCSYGKRECDDNSLFVDLLHGSEAGRSAVNASSLNLSLSVVV